MPVWSVSVSSTVLVMGLRLGLGLWGRGVGGLFDVCWAEEQGAGHTPQTGNEEF